MAATYNVTTNDAGGSTQTSSPLAFDAALADWVHHEGAFGQALPRVDSLRASSIG